MALFAITLIAGAEVLRTLFIIRRVRLPNVDLLITVPVKIFLMYHIAMIDLTLTDPYEVAFG